MAKPTPRKSQTINRSFSGGEMSPELHGRSDLEKYSTGLATMTNWVPTVRGSMHKRAGTKYTSLSADPTNANSPALIPFVFNDADSFMLEFTNLKMRVYKNGALLGAPYELTTPYTEVEARQLRHVQSNDVMTLTHPSFAPRTLTRVTDTNWTLATEVYNARLGTLLAPTHVVGGASGPNAVNHLFVCSQYHPRTGRESVASPSLTVSFDFTTAGSWITLTAGSPAGGFTPSDPLGHYTKTDLPTYRFYKNVSGVWGYIGEDSSGVIDVHNIAPDTSITPPLFEDQFTGTDLYPAAVGYWGQRKVYAATNTEPQTHWMSESGTESSFVYHQPVVATDSIEYTLASREGAAIRHIAELDDLYLLTSGAVWRARAYEGIVSASTLEYNVLSPIGSSTVRPLEVTNTLLYIGDRKQALMAINPDAREKDVAAVLDMSIMAEHLFKGRVITASAMVYAPDPIALLVRNDGIMLGMTYHPTEQVYGWFQITTDGDIIGDIGAIPSSESTGVDEVYMTVRRSGNWVIERLRLDYWFDEGLNPDRWYLDSCTAYTGAATTQITGLTHLQSRQVYVYDSGYRTAHGPFTINGSGVLDLNFTTSGQHVLVGLNYEARATLLPIMTREVRDAGLTDKFNAVEVGLTVRSTIGLLFESDDSGNATSQSDPDLDASTWDITDRETGNIVVPIRDDWSLQSDVSIIQDYPLPAQVMAAAVKVVVGSGA